MNKVILMGRLTKDPDIRNSGSTTVGRYTLAVDRRYKQDNGPTADFIQCVTFGKSAEFAEKYFHKGTKIAVFGRIQTGSYQKDGQTIYTTDVVVEEQEFAESKGSGNNTSSGNGSAQASQNRQNDGFMNIPNAIDEEVPFA